MMDKHSNWFGIQRPIISEEELHHVVSYYTRDDEFRLPDKLECARMQRSLHTLSWGTRADLYFILTEYYKSYKKRRLNWFYQEFMNKPYDPTAKMVERETFHETHIKTYIQDDQQCVEFTYKGIVWVGNCILYLGLDPASSIATNSDDTAIIVAGIARCYPRVIGQDWESSEASMPKGQLFPVILHVEGGKYSIYNYEKLPGMVETLKALDKRFRLSMIKIEANAMQIQIIREIRKAFKDDLRLTRIWEEYNTVKKDERIRSVLLSLAQVCGVFICQPSPYINTIYYQLLNCGTTDHDDYADALAIALKEAKEPGFKLINKYAEDFNEPSRYETLVKQYGEDAWMYI